VVQETNLLAQVLGPLLFSFAKVVAPTAFVIDRTSTTGQLRVKNRPADTLAGTMHGCYEHNIMDFESPECRASLRIPFLQHLCKAGRRSGLKSFFTIPSIVDCRVPIIWNMRSKVP
jgi:hypothetical protein